MTQQTDLVDDNDLYHKSLLESQVVPEQTQVQALAQTQHLNWTLPEPEEHELTTDNNDVDMEANWSSSHCLQEALLMSSQHLQQQVQATKEAEA